MPRRPLSPSQRKALFAKFAARKAGPTVHHLNVKVDELSKKVGEPGRIKESTVKRLLVPIRRDARRAKNIVLTQNR